MRGCAHAAATEISIDISIGGVTLAAKEAGAAGQVACSCPAVIAVTSAAIGAKAGGSAIDRARAERVMTGQSAGDESYAHSGLRYAVQSVTSGMRRYHRKQGKGSRSTTVWRTRRPQLTDDAAPEFRRRFVETRRKSNAV